MINHNWLLIYGLLKASKSLPRYFPTTLCLGIYPNLSIRTFHKYLFLYYFHPMNISNTSIPAESVLSKSNFHYSDSFVGVVKNDFTMEEAAQAFFQTTPGWVKSLMRLRNSIVKMLGLKVSDVPNDPAAYLRSIKWEAGESVGLFRIFSKAPDEIIFGQDDAHLNFRVSLLKTSLQQDKALTITTTVVFNNWFGRLYFLPVKFFHKPVVKAMIKSIIRDISK